MGKHSSYDKKTDTLRTDSAKAGSWQECTHIDHSEKGSSDSADSHIIITVNSSGSIKTDFGD